GGTLTDYPEWSSVPINYSYCVEWIDYDGDGDLDLACGNYDQPNTIYLNENSRLKTTPTWSSAPSNKTGGMDCGDFDGDGDMDLAFSNYWDNSIVIYLNKDIWAPSPVIDLAVVSTADTSVTLSWTATGDDSTVGTASFYDIRYSNLLITAGNFYDADTVAAEPPPQGVGSPETFEVTGLVSGLKYYFALKAGDVDNNWSDISNCVSAFTDLGSPEVTSVKDIPNDQGKRVVVSWNRSETDYNHGVEEQYIVTEYSLWRMIDDLSMMSPRERSRLLREIKGIQENAPEKETRTVEPAVEKFPAAKTDKQRIVEHPIDTGKDTAPRILKLEQEFTSWYPVRFNAPLVDIRFEGLLLPGTWLYMGSTPALQFESYALEASTYADSTGQGIPYFTFMVSAMTDDPFNHAESVPDSGYSVDNLSPCPPQNLILVEPNTISWDPNVEEDLDYYSIYAGTESGFDPSPESLFGSTSDTTYTMPDSLDGYYVFVTAIDFNGNESGPSNEIQYVTGIEEDPIPLAFALYQNMPNPFNPTTVIRFDLPRPVHVRLSIYNVKGELVTTVVDRHMEEGRKEVRWTARDDRGRAVSSGIYFYRLRAGDFVQTKKMVLLK
ncbi:MAG: VCBS repeat-containing protein, partial [bacterium]